MTSNEIHITRHATNSASIEYMAMTLARLKFTSKQLRLQCYPSSPVIMQRSLLTARQALVRPTRWRGSSMVRVRSKEVLYLDLWKKYSHISRQNRLSKVLSWSEQAIYRSIMRPSVICLRAIGPVYKSEKIVSGVCLWRASLSGQLGRLQKLTI